MPQRDELIQATLGELSSEPLAILPGALDALLARVVTGQQEADTSAAVRRPTAHGDSPGDVAVVPVQGFLSYRPGRFLGGTSTADLTATIRALSADTTVAAIVLDVDSPGGFVTGIAELAGTVAAAAQRKPVVAMVNAMAASAAYHVVSQASEIAVTPSGDVGSIGVFAMHMDFSRMLDRVGVTATLIHAGEHKVEGNPYQPLSESAAQEMQARVDEAYQGFVGAVATGRKVSTEKVIADFGGGRIVSAKRAQQVGMVDRIEEPGETLARIVQAVSRTTGRRAAAADRDRLSLAVAIADRGRR